MQILSMGQQSFNKQLQTQLYEPLVNIIKEFNRMSIDKTDESLKSFLFTFKIHIDQFNEVVHDLYQQITNGSKGIDELFIQTNKQIMTDIEKQQRQLLDDIASIKSQQILTDEEPFDTLTHLLQSSHVEK